MTLANRDLVENYATQNTNFRGDVAWRNGSMEADGPRLYSYSTVIALYLGYVDGKRTFLKNGDKYSITTSTHQGHVQSSCKGPTIPFSALVAANIRPERLKPENILDYQEDSHLSIHKHDGDDEWHVGWAYNERDGDPGIIFERPLVGMMIGGGRESDSEYATWHTLGGCLIEYEGRWLLCSLDGGNYFVSDLPSKPDSIPHAFQILKPPQVVKAEDDGISIQRQGEWFFIEQADLTDRDVAYLLSYKYLKDMRADLKQAPLPDDGQGNMHVARHLVGLGNLYTYVKGSVYHRNRWSGLATGEHVAIHLGNVWHLAYRNTALQSWSIGGNVD